MIVHHASRFRAPLAACLLVAWTGVAGAEPDDGTERDPAQVLKKRPKPQDRDYGASMAIDFGMMGVGRKKKKTPPRIEGPNIPEAREDFSMPNVAHSPTRYFPPPVAPERDDDKRKKNWLLPPRSQTDEQGDPLSDDPVDSLIRMYEEDEAARKRMIEGLFSGSSRLTLGQTEEDTRTEDGRDSRYSSYDGDVLEASENFLYTDGRDVEEDPADDGFGYSPVITGSAFDDPDDATRERTNTDRMSQTQLDQLSDEELAALAARQVSSAGRDESDMGGADSLPGVQQLSRSEGLNRLSGLQQMRDIVSGHSSNMNDGRMAAAGVGNDFVPTQPAAVSGTDSWRGTLSTLSGVLGGMNAQGQGTSGMDAMDSQGTSALNSVPASHPAMSRIRDQFSFGGGLAAAGFTPTGSSGIGSVGGSMGVPTSLDLDSSFSPGLSQPAQTDGGFPAIQPRERSLDLQNLEILMK